MQNVVDDGGQPGTLEQEHVRDSASSRNECLSRMRCCVVHGWSRACSTEKNLSCFSLTVSFQGAAGWSRPGMADDHSVPRRRAILDINLPEPGRFIALISERLSKLCWKAREGILLFWRIFRRLRYDNLPECCEQHLAALRAEQTAGFIAFRSQRSQQRTKAVRRRYWTDILLLRVAMTSIEIENELKSCSQFCADYQSFRCFRHQLLLGRQSQSPCLNAGSLGY
jgi:hypothetical protein